MEGRNTDNDIRMFIYINMDVMNLELVFMKHYATNICLPLTIA